MLLGGGLLLLYLVAQGVLMAVMAAVAIVGRGGAGGDFWAALEAQLASRAGLYFAVTTLITAPLVALAASAALWTGTAPAAPAVRRAAVRDFLGLARPRWSRAVPWFLATAAVLTVYEVASHLLGRPPAPDFMVDFLRTAGSPWLLTAAVVIGAPLAEEVIFRGVLLPGLAASRLGTAGAAVLTAALWAAIHGQYDLFDMSAVFTLGLVFAAARLHTRSLWPPLLLHAAVNAVAMLQMLWPGGSGG